MVRLRDVAHEAGVSVAAASVALGGTSATTMLSERTRQRILSAAKRLRFIPSPAATMLSTGKTHTIGLLLGNASAYLRHPDGGLTVNAMCEGADELDYRILLLRLGHGPLPDARLMDACVILGSIDQAHTQGLAELATRIPVVASVGGIAGAIPVILKNVAGEVAEMAAEHLYQLGHRDIAVVDVRFKQRHAVEGFREVARRRDLAVRLSDFSDNWWERRYPTIEEVCRLDPRPTAVYAFDDEYARFLVARLASDRLRVPAEVSVFSAETHRDGFQSVPPLTGITTSQDKTYGDIVRVLIGMLERDSVEKEIRLSLPVPELIVRASCAPPRIR